MTPKTHKNRHPRGYLDCQIVDYEADNPQKGCGNEHPTNKTGYSGASGHWLLLQQFHSWEFTKIHWRGDCYPTGGSMDGEN